MSACVLPVIFALMPDQWLSFHPKHDDNDDNDSNYCNDYNDYKN